MNGRQESLAIRGSVLAYTQDDRIMVRNLSNGAVRARFYKTEDTIRLLTLPGGGISVSGHGSDFFTVPSPLTRVQVFLGDRTLSASLGNVLTVNANMSITNA
jgi:hypothetical protein